MVARSGSHSLFELFFKLVPKVRIFAIIAGAHFEIFCMRRPSRLLSNYDTLQASSFDPGLML
jgi:hypothetical protein